MYVDQFLRQFCEQCGVATETHNSLSSSKVSTTSSAYLKARAEKAALIQCMAAAGENTCFGGSRGEPEKTKGTTDDGN